MSHKYSLLFTFNVQSLGLEIGSVFSIYFTTGWFENDYLSLNSYVINGENDVPHECWINRACCQLLGGTSDIHLKGPHAAEAWDGRSELRFWPLPTSMHSFTDFHGEQAWAHRTREGYSGGLKNVICKYERIVPPTWTWPRLSRSSVSQGQPYSISVCGRGGKFRVGEINV